MGMDSRYLEGHELAHVLQVNFFLLGGEIFPVYSYMKIKCHLCSLNISLYYAKLCLGVD